jgi:hypothetical protein
MGDGFTKNQYIKSASNDTSLSLSFSSDQIRNVLMSQKMRHVFKTLVIKKARRL